MSSYCRGHIKGDPDIAGIGVVAAIWISNGFAVVVGWGLWYLQYFRGANSDTSKVFAVLLKCAYALGDTAAVTLLAIIASSIILVKSSDEPSLYHIYIARELAFNTHAGLGAALCYDLAKRPNWHIRLFLVTGVIILHIYWTILTLTEFQSWSRATPKCFYNESRTPGTYTFWIMLDFMWTPVSWLWLWLDMFSDPRIQNFLESIDAFIPTLFGDAWRTLTTVAHVPLQVSSAIKLRQQFIFVTRTILTSLFSACWRVLAGAGLLIFVSPPSTSPVMSTVYWLWSMYELKSVWSANTSIVVECPTAFKGTSLQGYTNPENDWGFGQLFPLFLLLLPLLSLADFIVE